jgi:hypothetical protein
LPTSSQMHHFSNSRSPDQRTLKASPRVRSLKRAISLQLWVWVMAMVLPRRICILSVEDHRSSVKGSARSLVRSWGWTENRDVLHGGNRSHFCGAAPNGAIEAHQRCAYFQRRWGPAL